MLSDKQPCGKNIFCQSVVGRYKTVGTSFSCKEEAVLAVKYVRVLLDKYRQRSVVILCYYKAQVILIRQLMPNVYRNMNLVICSIEAFQGKEAASALVSTCAQRGLITPHLTDRRRTNVAMSRGNVASSYWAIHKPYEDLGLGKTIYKTRCLFKGSFVMQMLLGKLVYDIDYQSEESALHIYTNLPFFWRW